MTCIVSQGFVPVGSFTVKSEKIRDRILEMAWDDDAADEVARYVARIVRLRKLCRGPYSFRFQMPPVPAI